MTVPSHATKHCGPLTCCVAVSWLLQLLYSLMSIARQSATAPGNVIPVLLRSFRGISRETCPLPGEGWLIAAEPVGHRVGSITARAFQICRDLCLYDKLHTIICFCPSSRHTVRSKSTAVQLENYKQHNYDSLCIMCMFISLLCRE